LVCLDWVAWKVDEHNKQTCQHKDNKQTRFIETINHFCNADNVAVEIGRWIIAQ